MGRVLSSPEIPKLAYAAFAERVLLRAGKRRAPVGMSLELTAACNLRCVHCYMGGCAPGRAGVAPELTTPELTGLLDEAADLGMLWLLITGGEPLLRRDFHELYVHAQRLGLLITLFTNGTLVTETVADLLGRWPPVAVEVTVHSAEASVFDGVCGVDGAYRRCLSGVRRLIDRGVNVRLKAVALRENRGELDGVRRLAVELGAPFRFDPHVFVGLDGDGGPAHSRLTPREIVDLDLSDASRLEEWRGLWERRSRGKARRVYECGAGVQTLHVSAVGKVSPCVMTQHRCYELRGGSLAEAWNDFMPRAVSRLASPGYRCGSCDMAVLCGRCPAWAYLEAGDEEAPIDYLCELGTLRRSAIVAAGVSQDDGLAVPLRHGGR